MSGNKRYRIGLFTVLMEGEDFNSPSWKYINRQCMDLDMDLIIFPGRNLIKRNDNQEIFDSIFDFFDPEQFDGLIFLSAILINAISIERLTQQIKKIKKVKKIPIISIGLDLGISSSIVFDNYAGTSHLVDHLLTVHNFKNFGYLDGPKDHPECISRLKGTRDSLKKVDLEIESKNLFQGDFTNFGLETILQPLLDRKKLDIDVLMCANDTMATKAIDILKDYGYSVPEDIAVTGFDNSLAATYQSPSITTIKQPSEKVASDAVNILYTMLNEGQERVDVIIESEIIINESCGCNKITDNKSDRGIGILELTLQESISNKDSKFIYEIRNFLYMSPLNYDVLQFEKIVLNRFDQLLLESSKTEELGFINKLYRDVIILFKEYELKQNFKREQLESQKKLETRYQYEKLLTSIDLQSLFSNIYNIFSWNSIDTFYLLLNKNREHREDIKLVFAVNEGKKIDCINNKFIFKKTEFLSNTLLPTKDRTTLVSQPLFSLNRCFGHIVLEVRDKDSSFYPDAQMNISSALMSILSLRDLKETQQLLIESEKMAFLGNLVAGLAHEINTPVGVTVTAGSHLEDLIKNIYSEYEENTLTKNKMESFLFNAKESSFIIKKNLKTTIKLVNRFKKISADSNFELTKVFDLSDFIEKTINKLNTEHNNKKILINLDLPQILFIDSYAGVYSEILINLFYNSVIHGFKLSPGEINIKVVEEGNKLILTYSDSGTGCGPDELSKMFDPFFTTKRFDGYSGLGLTIIYNLIKNKLRGDIKVSMIDGRLTFIMTIPI